MEKPGRTSIFSPWLKGLGWVAFGVLALATLLVVARWVVMGNGHRVAERRVSLLKKSHSSAPVAGLPTSALPTEKAPGLPLSGIPHFGAAFSGDESANDELVRQAREIWDFLRCEDIHHESGDGLRSFRAVLRDMGVEVPETMTEEEAAKEFLKRADRFSGFLSLWREAVAKGPLEVATDPRFAVAARPFFELLGITTEARLRAGDPAGAWQDWETMRNTRERSNEAYPTAGDNYDSQLSSLGLLGLRYGAWTGDQMGEISSMVAQKNPAADMRRNVEDIKGHITDFYTNFDKHRESFSDSYLKPSSQIDQLANEVRLKLVTRQQIRDNMEMELSNADRFNRLFDPDTGFYLPPPDEDGASETSGTFYFMIQDLRMPEYRARREALYEAERVIWQQSGNDQFRLALALETYRQKTGTYPDHLEAVAPQFPGGPPLDIATGQPYFYQKNPEGGFTLWGTGIDGKSDGGDTKTDITWQHVPVKR